MSDGEWNPETYLATMHEEVPGYEELQDAVAAATEKIDAGRVLELGTGTGETAVRILTKHPSAHWVGIDASEPMLAQARERLPNAELHGSRLEDELPPGPFDLVVSALAIHHLDAAGKRNLFARIASVLRPGGHFVLGDVVVPTTGETGPIEIDWVMDLPDSVEDQLSWLKDVGFAAEARAVRIDLAVFDARRLEASETLRNGEAAELTSLHPEVRRYSEELVDRLRRTLGAKLVGVYLHGSAALGDFTSARSDVDVIAVASDELSGQERTQLSEELAPAALPCLATGLEFHVVATSTLANVTDAPPFEVHIATDTENGTERFVDGLGRAGDSDLVMHYAVLKAHGITLLGPPASELFPEVPRNLMLSALRRELDWGVENASSSYQVLNAARAWRFAETGEIVSKTKGGEWARSRVDDPAIIDAALVHRRAAGDEHPEAVGARAFVGGVRERLA